MTDDRQPTIEIDGERFTLDEVVNIHPILKPFRDRGVVYQKHQREYPLATVKQQEISRV